MASWKKLSERQKMRIYSKGLKPNEIFLRKEKQNIFLATIYRFLESFPPFCNSIFFFFKNRFIACQVASYATSCNKIFY